MDSGFLTIPKPEGYVPHFGVLIFITSVVLFFVYAKQKEGEMYKLCSGGCGRSCVVFLKRNW